MLNEFKGLCLLLALELGTEQSSTQVTHSAVTSIFCQPLVTWYTFRVNL